MPASDQAAAGTVLAVDKTGATTTYTTIGQVVSITGVGGGEVGEREATHLSSVMVVKKPTIPEPTEIEMELNFDPSDTDHQFVRDLAATPELLSWKVTFPTDTPTTATFQGWVKSFDGVDAGGVDESLTATVTLIRTSVVTWA